MRWTFVLPRLLIAGFVWAFFVWGFDPLLRHGAIYMGESVVEARVDIDRLQTEFFPPRVNVGRLEIADPKSPEQNLLQWDDADFHLAGRALLRKSYIVSSGEVTGLRWGAQRDASGELNRKQRDPNKPSRWDRLEDQAEDYADAWFDRMIEQVQHSTDLDQFESVRLAKQKEDEWKRRFDMLEQRVKDVERKSKLIRDIVKQKGGNPLDRVAAYRQAFEDANGLMQETAQIRREFEQLPNLARNDFNEINAARQRDQAALEEKIGQLKFDTQAIAESIVGSLFQERGKEILAWVRWAQEKSQAWKGTSGKPAERQRGVVVEFPVQDRLPKYLVESLKVSGLWEIERQEIPFQGTIAGLTSEPAVYGRPMVITANADAQAKINAEAIVDLREAEPRCRFDVTVDYPHPAVKRFGRDAEWELALASANTKIRADVQVIGEKLGGDIHIAQDELNVSLAGQRLQRELDELTLGALAAALKHVQALNAQIQLGGTLEEPDWKLTSNIGPQLQTGFQQAAVTLADAKREELTAKLDGQVQDRMTDWQSTMNERFARIQSQLVESEKLTGESRKSLQELLKSVAGGRSGVQDGLDLLQNIIRR